jgi:cation transport ATPase
VRALLQLAPAEATLVCEPSGGPEPREVSLDARLLWRGDLVAVKGGERLPCDGVLERDWTGGRAALDEAMLTGESMPVHKRQGDLLLGGTVNRSNAPLWIRATNTG